MTAKLNWEPAWADDVPPPLPYTNWTDWVEARAQSVAQHLTSRTNKRVLDLAVSASAETDVRAALANEHVLHGVNRTECARAVAERASAKLIEWGYTII